MERYGKGYGTGMKKYGNVRKMSEQVWKSMEQYGKVLKSSEQVWKSMEKSRASIWKSIEKV